MNEDIIKSAIHYYNKGEPQETKKILKKLVEENFFDVPSQVLFILGRVYLEEKNIFSAKFYLEKFLEKTKNQIESIIDIARLYINSKLYNDLIIFLDEKINIIGKKKEFFYFKSKAMFSLGKTWLAILNINKAIQIDNDYIIAHFARLSYFPYIYKNNAEIIKFRSYYEKNLDLFIEKFIDKIKLSPEESISITSSSINFLLPYQGFDDKKLQYKYSKILNYFISFIEPIILKEKKNTNKISKKINIGFVSYFMYQHTITNLFKNWILNLNKNIFNISIFNCGNIEDEVTNRLKKYSDKYYKCYLTYDQISKINSECLDIIIYFDLGMSAQTQLLSVARLAKFQFVTWGHPITTGSDKIDYFLSSKLMENNNAQDSYTEHLINLEGIGISYDYESLQNFNFEDNDKKKISHNFLCLQNLRKIIPNNDKIFSKILSLDYGLSFFADKISSVNSIFIKRIEKNILNDNLNYKNQLKFIDPCERFEFLKIINSTKIILDTVSWSGGNTHLEALYLNKPIVTMKSNSLRANHTFAMLRLIHLDELIANDEEDYLKIAKKLIVDDDYRLFIVDKIKKNKHLLFSNKTNTFNDFILNFTKENFQNINDRL